MSRIQKYDITDDGLLMALPSLFSGVLSLVSGTVADMLRRNGYMSTLNVRRLFTCFTLLAIAAPLLFMKTVGCDHLLVSVLLTASSGLAGCIVGGVAVNHLDIAHNYAGTVMGITNSFGTAAGILTPIIIGQITNTNETMARWQTCFYISTSLAIFGAVFFVCFANGTEMEWNKLPQSRNNTAEADVYTDIQS